MAVAGFVGVLLLAAVGLVVYDSNREDRIAEGVTVGGVAVGGMTRAEAAERIESEVAARLQEPIRAKYEDERFTLKPEKMDVAVDVEASVDEAVRVSRQGNILTRTFRGLTGGEVDENVRVEVTYDRDRVERMVRRIAGELDRPPRDADVEISVAGVERVKGRRGLEVDGGWLARAVRRKLDAPRATRLVEIRANEVEPEITMREVEKKYPSIIVVDRSSFRLQLYEDLKPTRSYTIAIGAAGYETPTGLYEIQNKQVDPYWTVPNSDWAGSLAGQVIPPGPSNPLKSRWMGIYNGAGIHGTDATSSLGSAASRGCIRMAIPDVEELYEQIDVGTPIYIA
jgi:lipoprotein-anchoring transpeptidase ErfK/SrfK